MCTAAKMGTLCGRTLDLEYSYEEQVVVTPRKHPLSFRHDGVFEEHLAIMGVGIVQNGVPLYYDAVNEAGLWVAGLNFPKSAVYMPPKEGFVNLASFEVIPRLLAKSKSVAQAVALLENVNVTSESVSSDLSASPLHFFLADSTEAVVAEPLAEGLKVTKDPFGVLTNEPPFAYHESHLATFMGLSPKPPRNTFCPELPLAPFSRGMGALGLPGDWSSPSRFVRALFAKSHTALAEQDPNGVDRFFHVMDTVAVPLGCVLTDEGRKVYTVYTSCADLEKGVYSLTTYQNRSIQAFSFTEENKNASTLTVSPLFEA